MLWNFANEIIVRSKTNKIKYTKTHGIASKKYSEDMEFQESTKGQGSHYSESYGVLESIFLPTKLCLGS